MIAEVRRPWSTEVIFLLFSKMKLSKLQSSEQVLRNGQLLAKLWRLIMDSKEEQENNVDKGNKLVTQMA